MNPLAPSARPGYWEQGIDPTTGRFGIPADKHPDVKAAHKRLLAITKEQEAIRESENEAIFGWIAAHPGETFEPEYVMAPNAERRAALRAERKALLATIPTNLYRTNGSSTSGLAIRYDRVGKEAWEAELKRLGRK